MIGAIAGDIIGSIYEHDNIKTKDFSLFKNGCSFTDDTVLTVAVAKAVLTDGNYKQSLWDFGGKYPNAGFGASFVGWLRSLDPQPYNSWGNGSAMRVSPIGFAFDTVDLVLKEAEKSAIISHNHPEGIKGAQATALAIFYARTTKDKDYIRKEISTKFGYNLNRNIDEIRPDYHFDVSCQGSVPEAIIAFLDSDSFEDAIRNAISIGGDSDTIACITGGIAEAYYGSIPSKIQVKVNSYLSKELIEIVNSFQLKYIKK